jgi:hypothetical protein
MCEKEIRREMRISKLGGWTAIIGAFVPLIGAVIMVVLVDSIEQRFDLPGALLVLAMALLFLVLALGLAMCSAIFFLNRRQEENSLRLIEMVSKAPAPRIEGA